MKKYFTIIFLFTFMCLANAQWSWQNPYPTGNWLNSVKFISSNVGYAVGSGGEILKTTNGGTDWALQKSGTNVFLTAVSFSDLNNGIVVGEDGLILRTSDGGATWIQQSSGTNSRLLDVSFTDANNGTAVTYYGTILRTTNGGTTWTNQISGTTEELFAVSFTDANTGTVVGTKGTILRTTNGGTTWTQQSSGTTELLRGVAFTDINNGTVVGTNGIILTTTNGGTTWTKQTSGTANELTSVSFTDVNTGTAVGSNGTILRTSNGGANWTKQSSGTTKDLWGVSFIDANTGTAVGRFGTTLRTTNAGKTWVSQNKNITSNILRGVSFTDANSGTVVGDSGIVFRTINGGESWIQQTTGIANNLLGVSFTDANTGTIVGDLGLILRTTDGGTTWVLQNSKTLNSLTGVAFTNANNGTVVGDLGTILRTTDGGTSWVLQNSGTLNYLTAVSFTDSNNGTVVGSGGLILRTTTGGTTWTQQTSGTRTDLNGVSFTDANTGTVVGWNGTILRTTNGGTTWTKQTSGTSYDLWGVSFTDANIGKVVGQEGTILTTTDGGNTWTYKKFGFRHLFGVSFPDANNGTAVGQAGAVLRYNLGFINAEFPTRTDFAADGSPSDIASADFNSDGKPDIAVSNWDSSSVSVFINTTQTGSTSSKFSARADYKISKTGSAVEIGDINNDGKPDLVAANWNDSVSVLINQTAAGDTNSSFMKAVNFSSGYQAGPNSIAIDDLNSDGKLDLVVSNQFPDINSEYHIAVLFNTTTTGNTIPSFTSYTHLISGAGPFDVVTADFNIDGTADIAVANFTDGTVSVFLNSTQVGSTTAVFSSKKDFAVGQGAMGIDAADFNADGYIDLAIANQNSDNISILMNTTASTSSLSFGNHIDFPGEAGPNSITIHDIDNDGKPELVVTNSSAKNVVSVFFNGWANGEFNPYFGDNVSYNVGELPASSVVADLNGDRRMDIVTANSSGKSISVLLNTSTITGIRDEIKLKPNNFSLNQNYPNPFNPTTTISYQLSAISRVTLKIYDILGREVTTLVNEEQPAGNYKINFDASRLASGVYFYRIVAGDFIQTKKMVLLK